MWLVVILLNIFIPIISKDLQFAMIPYSLSLVIFLMASKIFLYSFFYTYIQFTHTPYHLLLPLHTCFNYKETQMGEINQFRFQKGFGITMKFYDT